MDFFKLKLYNSLAWRKGLIMDKKTKKIICAIGVVTIMTGTVATLTPALVNNNESNYNNYSDADYTSQVNDLAFDDEFNRRTFYVQKNDDSTILSLNKDVEGYNLMGIYSSKSSSDKVLYIFNSNTKKVMAVDYDYLEGHVLEEGDNVYVITEDAPESVKKDAFIPECSIDKIGYSKTLK